MISRLACIGLCVAAACGSSGAPAPAAGSDSPAPSRPNKPAKPKHVDAAPRPQPKLVVTSDGKPVAMTGALAWRTGGGGSKLIVSSLPLGCDDVRDGMRMIRDGELSFDLTLGSILQPDGSFATMLHDISEGSMALQQPTKVAMTDTGSAGEATTVDLDFDSASVVAGDHPFALKGTIDALGCASPPAKPAPPLPPELPATLTVAGHTLPIRGARISKDSMPSLELTTGGEACDPAAGYTDSDFSLMLTWFDPKKPVGQLSLMGEQIGRQVADQTFDRKQVSVTPLPLAPGEVTLAIDVVVEGYPVKVAGKVMADVCKDAVHVTLP